MVQVGQVLHTRLRRRAKGSKTPFALIPHRAGCDIQSSPLATPPLASLLAFDHLAISWLSLGAFMARVRLQSRAMVQVPRMDVDPPPGQQGGVEDGQMDAWRGGSWMVDRVPGRGAESCGSLAVASMPQRCLASRSCHRIGRLTLHPGPISLLLLKDGLLRIGAFHNCTTFR